MTIEAEQARNSLGLLLRKFRQSFPLRTGESKNQLSRLRLSSAVSVNKISIINLEHGIPNPTREVFEKVINYLRLPENDSDEAYRLLNLFSSPRKWERRGYKAPFTRLEKKRQRWQVRR